MRDDPKRACHRQRITPRFIRYERVDLAGIVQVMHRRGGDHGIHSGGDGVGIRELEDRSGGLGLENMLVASGLFARR